MKAKQFMENVFLFAITVFCIILSYPFWVLYCFGKALCDLDEYEKFFGKATNMLMKPVETNNVARLVKENKELNEKLKEVEL